ncbi:MAG: competence/damage-inducible protein A [Kosmotogaceae bacterium]
MNAEIINVGTEILLGNIINTNSTYLSRKLAELGINLYKHTVVGDNMERLTDSINDALSRVDIVITTGGLGPTQDDITKEAVAKCLDKKLILDNESLKHIECFFKNRNKSMNEYNKKQAYFPEGSKILENTVGTAPGCIVEDKGKIIILLPGPPHEMIEMFEQNVFNYLRKKSEQIIHSRFLRLFGIGESDVVKKIEDIIEEQDNPTIAPYADGYQVSLRITANTKNKSYANIMINNIEKRIQERLGQYIYSKDNETLESVVLNALIKNNKTISFAESCTGGMISAKIVGVPGASKAFLGTVVAYSNEIKIRELNTPKKTLRKYGAVSEETAKEMARDIRKSFGSDIGLSTTGIAGPSGGTPEKPVGTVYIGLSYGEEDNASLFHFKGDRNRIRTLTTIHALDLIRKTLQIIS